MADNSFILALDSSADIISVAVLDGDWPLAERSWRAPRPHSEGLLPAAVAMLADARMEIGSLGLVAVATGPGSFNGIRGGIAVAQGLALARTIPAVGVSTLDAMAYQQAGRAGVICAVLPAGRGELYCALYEGTWHDWHRRDDYAVGTPTDLVVGLPPETLLCGTIPDELAALASARGLTLAPPFAAFSRAAFVGALAALRRHDPTFDAPASLQPLYLRRPGITRPTRALSRT